MRAKRTAEQIEALVQEAVRRVRQLAVGGVAPSTERYNQDRAGALSTDMLFRYGVTWGDVVRRAGLRMAKSGYGSREMLERRRQILNMNNGVPAEVEAEIKAAFAAQEETAAWLRAWPMRAIPTRLEVREIPLPDGSGVFRVTRAYASLR